MDLRFSEKQSGIYFEQLRSPESTQFVIGVELQLSSEVDVKAMRDTILCMVKAFDILSMTPVVAAGGECVQRFAQAKTDFFHYLDLSNQDNPEQDLQQDIETLFYCPFDLFSDELFFTKLYRLGRNRHRLLIKAHHIVTDGFSLDIFCDVLWPIYAQKMAKQHPVVINDIFDFKIEMEKESHYLDSDQYIKDNLFWQKKLDAMPDLFFYPISQNSSEGALRSANVKLPLGDALTAKLRVLAQKSQVSLQQIGLAALTIYLSRVYDRHKVLIGTTLHHRNNHRKKRTFGPLAGDIPCLFQLGDNPSVGSLLDQISQELRKSFRHSRLPQSHLARALKKNNPERENLFDTVFNYERRVGNYTFDNSDIIVNHLFNRQEPIPVHLRILDFGGVQPLFLHLSAHVKLMTEAECLLFVRRISYILEQFTSGPIYELPVGSIKVLPPSEIMLLNGFSGPSAPYSSPRVLNVLLEQKACEVPEAKAVSHGDHQWSYQRLNKQANRIAHHLLSRGVKKSQLVAVYSPRNIMYLASMLAIWKVGAAYVPLHHKNPKDRIEFFLEDSKPAIILLDPGLLENIPPPYKDKTVNLTDAKSFERYPATNPGNLNAAEDPAYIIYTSGSTGKPKGAIVHHGGAVHHINALMDALGLVSDGELLPLCVLQSASVSSDISLWQFIAPIASGGTTSILNNIADVQSLVEVIQKDRVQLLECVPVVLRLLIDYLAPLEAREPVMPSLRWLVTTGDTVPAPLINDWFSLGLDVSVVNAYGPTETADDVTVHIIHRPVHKQVQSIPIGRPLANTSVHLVNKKLELLPLGVAGELCISGQCVGLGYLNDPDKSAAAFVANPFAGQPGVFGGTMYRSGDIAKWDSDGLLHFIGRVDNQVKIRGHRIELGDVEACLAKHADVNDLVVIAKSEPGVEKYLHAFLTKKPPSRSASGRYGGKLTSGSIDGVEGIKAYASSVLPDYMVPKQFSLLEQMPRNMADKIDRKALAAMKPNISQNHSSAEIMEPGIEAWLAGQWSKLIGVPRLGISRSCKFFMLGGDSLSAIRLVLAIGSKWRVDIEFKHIFANPVFSQQVEFIRRNRGRHFVDTPITSKNLDRAPLSQEQKRIWFAGQLHTLNKPYNANVTLNIKGPVNLKALDRALVKVVDRHSILRTAYRDEGSGVYQVTGPSPESIINYVNACDLSESEAEVVLAKLERESIETPFCLDTDLMLRCYLIQLAREHWRLMITVHHIASDGWSQGIILNELARLYAGYLAGADNSPSLPPLPVQYQDYAHWQNAFVHSPVASESLEYWTHHLSDLATVHNVPLDFNRPKVPSYQGGLVTCVIHKQRLAAMYDLISAEQVTPFMFLTAVFACFLHGYSGDQEVVFGSPIANREKQEIANLVGFFVNTLVYKTRFREGDTLINVLGQVRENALNGFEHKNIPFECLVDALKPSRSSAYNPLFQVMLTLEDDVFGNQLLADAETTLVQPKYLTSLFDLNLNISDTPSGLSLSWVYATDLFERRTVQRMSENFERLLLSLCEHPHRELNQAQMLCKQESHDLIYLMNRTQRQYPKHQLVHELFEQQVNVYPHKVALVFESEKLTYCGLNQASNRLAHYLRQQGVKTETLVGICVARSFDMFIGILAILKAGGAYVPLDPNYPAARLKYMLEDTQVEHLVTHAGLVNSLGLSHKVTTIELDRETTRNKIEACRSDNLLRSEQQTAANLAYIIYTSGSSGSPKGVMIEHQSAVNLYFSQTTVFKVSEHSKVLQFASLSFDAGVSEWLMALLNGAVLAICNESQRHSAPLLGEFLSCQRITHATLPPSLLSDLPLKHDYSLQALVVAGESCNRQLIDAWLVHYPMFNAYGPSEAAVCATVAALQLQQVVNIGKPIDNTSVLVLGSSKALLPKGATGELYIGGAGVARGYVNKPELTAERFIQLPFADAVFSDKHSASSPPSGERTGRFYRTGDLVRYLADGNLEFIGRVDDQVKIRGFRIELGEVQHSLNACDGVLASAIVAREDTLGQQGLIAYVVSGLKAGGSDRAIARDLRSQLKNRLPNFMIPSAFVVLDQLPLTANGKVDKKALPLPEGGLSQGAYVAPSTDTERALVDILSGLFNVAWNTLSVAANFFELGGHSLLAVRLIMEVANQLDVELDLELIFDAIDLREIAKHIDMSLLVKKSRSGSDELVEEWL